MNNRKRVLLLCLFVDLFLILLVLVIYAVVVFGIDNPIIMFDQGYF